MKIGFDFLNDISLNGNKKSIAISCDQKDIISDQFELFDDIFLLAECCYFFINFLLSIFILVLR